MMLKDKQLSTTMTLRKEERAFFSDNTVRKTHLSKA